MITGIAMGLDEQKAALLGRQFSEFWHNAGVIMGEQKTTHLDLNAQKIRV